MFQTLLPEKASATFQSESYSQQTYVMKTSKLWSPKTPKANNIDLSSSLTCKQHIHNNSHLVVKNTVQVCVFQKHVHLPQYSCIIIIEYLVCLSFSKGIPLPYAVNRKRSSLIALHLSVKNNIRYQMCQNVLPTKQVFIQTTWSVHQEFEPCSCCLSYTSDAAD